MLETYHKKRDFKKTTEPKGKKTKPNQKPCFVIQKHHASQLHYDFRLEMSSVLKSWAVPKGIPTKYGEKHLAVLTEDHPLEYADFEGTIPEGEYGAGEVIIWDKGDYENITVDKKYQSKSIEKAFEDGHILMRLYGKRLNDKCFALHRFRQGKKELWLLFKVKLEKIDTD